MDLKRKFLAISGALVCGLSAAAWAEAPATDVAAELNALKAQVAQQKAEIDDLKGQSDQKWLNQERTDEVKALIRDVIADADTRASLQGNTATAGNDNGKFFIASADNSFRLNIGAQIQFRYIADLKRTNNLSSTVGGHQDGFQLRRMEPSFDGYIGNPKFEYNVILQSDKDSGTVTAKIAAISYTFGDSGFKVFGGRIYDTFAREAMMSSKRQQTVERSVVDNVFAKNDDIVEGVGVEWKALPDYLIVSATYNDGLNSGTLAAPAINTTLGGTGGHDFENGAADAAATARIDGKLAGDWAQNQDVESWSTAPDLQAFLGLAGHYELAKSGDKQAAGTLTASAGTSFKYDEFYQWTADGLVKYHGLGVMGSVYGLHFRDTTVPGDLNWYGATAQAGYTISDKFEPFVRYEYIYPDKKAGTNQLNIVTAGFNWFIKKHAAKFTLDTVMVFNNLNAVNTLNSSGTALAGLGLLPDDAGKRGQVVIRAQFQLLF